MSSLMSMRHPMLGNTQHPEFVPFLKFVYNFPLFFLPIWWLVVTYLFQFPCAAEETPSQPRIIQAALPCARVPSVCESEAIRDACRRRSSPPSPSPHPWSGGPNCCHSLMRWPCLAGRRRPKRGCVFSHVYD